MMKKFGFTSFLERIDSKKIRGRSKSFLDHFSQATMFYNSQSEAEKTHMVNALRFELGKVKTPDIRVRMVGLLTQVDKGLAEKVAAGLGVPAKGPVGQMNHSVPADEDPKAHQPIKMKPPVERSEALSMQNTAKDSIATRRIAFLVADGVDAGSVKNMKKALEAEGAAVRLIAPRLGAVKTSEGTITPDESFLTAASVLFDAVFVPAGKKSVQALQGEADAVHFLNEAYKHCKAIAAEGDGVTLLEITHIDLNANDPGVVAAKAGTAKAFIDAIAQHRFWERETARKVPA
jgi:catalase